MTYSVKIEDGSVFQNGVLVATIYNGWGMGSSAERKFLIRSRKGNSEAASFLKHMLKVLTVDELAKKVAISSPVEVGAYYGWVLPHFKTWVKRGVMTQSDVDAFTGRLKTTYVEKLAKSGAYP